MARSSLPAISAAPGSAGRGFGTEAVAAARQVLDEVRGTDGGELGADSADVCAQGVGAADFGGPDAVHHLVGGDYRAACRGDRAQDLYFAAGEDSAALAKRDGIGGGIKDDAAGQVEFAGAASAADQELEGLAHLAQVQRSPKDLDGAAREAPAVPAGGLAGDDC